MVQEAPEGGVLVDKPLTIVLLEEDGEPFTLDASERRLGMRIEASDVTVQGMRIVGDSDTYIGMRLNTGNEHRGELATENITLVNNRIEGMQYDETGDHCWGIRSFGEFTLSGVSIKENEILDIGGGSTTGGIGIGLEELEGEEPGEGAILEENEIRGIASPDDPTDLTPTAGIAINPNEGGSSGAGPPGAKVEKNIIVEAPIDVTVGDLRATSIIDGIV